MGLSRRRFTREFKMAAIERLEQGVAVGDVARALEVNPNVLQRWRREFRPKILKNKQLNLLYIIKYFS